MSRLETQQGGRDEVVTAGLESPPVVAVYQKPHQDKHPQKERRGYGEGGVVRYTRETPCAPGKGLPVLQDEPYRLPEADRGNGEVVPHQFQGGDPDQVGYDHCQGPGGQYRYQPGNMMPDGENSRSIGAYRHVSGVTQGKDAGETCEKAYTHGGYGVDADKNYYPFKIS